jgi:hypothetical protein
MYQLRLYHYNNTPYQFQKDKYADEMSKLHMELNFLNSRLMMKRVLFLCGIIGVYYWVFYEEPPLDWKDSFDIKHDIKAFGKLADAESEGQYVDD